MMNNIQVRGVVTVIICLSYSALIFLGIESLETWVFLLAFYLMMPVVIVIGAMWGMFGNTIGENQTKSDSAETSTEKVKRERLDNVLRNLSNEELVALKQRLSDGSIDDDLLYEHMTLSDDGELISLER